MAFDFSAFGKSTGLNLSAFGKQEGSFLDRLKARREEGQEETVKKDIGGDFLRNIVAGGFPKVFSGEPAPETFVGAVKERVTTTGEKIKAFEEAPIEEKAQKLAFSFQPAGSAQNIGNKIPKGKIIDMIGDTKDLVVTGVRNAVDDIANTNNVKSIFSKLKSVFGGTDEAVTKVATKLQSISNADDVIKVIKENSDLNIRTTDLNTSAFEVKPKTLLETLKPTKQIPVELKPLTDYSRKFDTPEAFSNEMKRIFEKSTANKRLTNIEKEITGIADHPFFKEIDEFGKNPPEAFYNITKSVDDVKVPVQEVPKTIPQQRQALEVEAKLKEVDGISTKVVDIEKKLPQQVQKIPQVGKVSTIDSVPEVSSKKIVAQERKLNKTLTENGRVLVDEKGVQVFPKPIKQSPMPMESSIMVELEKDITKRFDKIVKNYSNKSKKALDTVNKKRGDTEKIVESLKKSGVTKSETDRIVLESGDKLTDTVKVKRESNGVLSATIRKDTLENMKEDFSIKGITNKWIPTKTAVQKTKELGRNSKNAVLDYYELPQVFFDRTGLRKYFYDPIRQAERNAQDMKTAIFNEFDNAGLLKEGGWFTADRFDITKTQSENIGKYYLTRQGKGGNTQLTNLSTKEKKFVEVFDNVIKESEERFFRVAELNGKSPNKVDNYAPIMTNSDIKLAQETADMDFIFRKHPSFFSLKQRTEKVPFEAYELDYRVVSSRWIDQMANFNHLGEVTPQVKYLANSEQFKDIVGDRIFNTTNKWLKNKLSPQVLSPAEKLGRFARQKSAIASLGLNMSSVIKQVLTQVPLTIIEKAPPKLTSKFARDFGINVKDLASIKERKGNVSIMDMQEGFNRAFVGPLSEFDKTNAQLSLNRLLDKNYSKFLKEGKPVTGETQARIIKEAQDTLDLWYGGMTTSQLPVAFRTELGKLINMFIYPLTSQLNGFVYSVAKAKGINKAEKFAEIMASALVIAYMEQVITNLSPKWSDTKEMTKDTLASLAGNIPILSQFVFAFRSDQPISGSPIISGVSRAIQQASKYKEDQATAGDVAFAFSEMLGLPKQIRRSVQGAELVREGGLRDKKGKLLAPVESRSEKIRAFLRGKYGTIATQDYVRNIGVKSANRTWFVPEVEFLQNGDYDRKAELYNAFDKETQDELYAEFSEGQQKKLDKAIANPPKKPTTKDFIKKLADAVDEGTITTREAKKKLEQFKELINK